MKYIVAALVALLLCLCGANAAPLKPLTCYGHAALQKAMTKTRKQALVAASILPDGRTLEIYADLAKGHWSSVVVQNAKGVAIAPGTCAVLFGDGDPGVLLPAPPVVPVK